MCALIILVVAWDLIFLKQFGVVLFLHYITVGDVVSWAELLQLLKVVHII